jgi:hypothetical protein
MKKRLILHLRAAMIRADRLIALNVALSSSVSSSAHLPPKVKGGRSAIEGEEVRV